MKTFREFGTINVLESITKYGGWGLRRDALFTVEITLKKCIK